MFKNVHQINTIHRLSKTLLGFQNSDLIADTLSNNGTLVPVCPIGNYVYRYDPCFERVLRLKVVEIKYTETECFYDLECYENGSMVTYFSVEEKEFGARCYLSRSAAKRNTNIVSADNAKISFSNDADKLRYVRDYKCNLLLNEHIDYKKAIETFFYLDVYPETRSRYNLYNDLNSFKGAFSQDEPWLKHNRTLTFEDKKGLSIIILFIKK